MLKINSLIYRIAGRTLLNEASAQISAGHKVGLIGRNGAGKSTLLGLILGELHGDGGSIEVQRNIRIGVVEQESKAGSASPTEVVLAADTERATLLERAETETDPDQIGEIHMRLADIDAHSAPARAAEILAGLGFDDEMQNRPMTDFSGGWRMRVALAAVLFSQPDLLLLDEPTNHLDLEASVWLESYLKAYPGTMLLISHDRHILNSVVDHILHLDQQKLTYYPGGYDDCMRLRSAQIEQTKAAQVRMEARRKHLQSFVDRFGAKASKATQAQSRVKALAKLGTATLYRDEATYSFTFPEPPEMAPPLISLENVAIGYQAGKPVLTGLNQRIDPDDRIALLGSNGNGKSTFAKLIAGRLDPMGGYQHRANKLRCGFFAQHQIEDMRAEESAFDHMARVMPQGRELEIRNKLGRFGFSGDKAFVKIKELSGGERARLNFALITADAPPILILDEPTNHLDIESREALAEAINDFPGAVILITHDWHLLELTADRLWLVANGKVTPFEGDLDAYRKLMLTKKPQGKEKGGGSGSGGGGKQKKSGNQKKELDQFRKKARDAEAALLTLNGELSRVERELIDPKLTNYDRVNLMRLQTDISRKVEAAETAWLEAGEALEREQA